MLLTHCAHAHCLQFEHSGNGLMSHIRETSKVTISTSYFHPAHQHYTDEAQKAETVTSVYLRSLESNSKSMRVTSPSTCLSKIVYYVISSTYIITEIEKLVSCVDGVLMHSGNVGRTLEKRMFGEYSRILQTFPACIITP